MVFVAVLAAAVLAAVPAAAVAAGAGTPTAAQELFARLVSPAYRHTALPATIALLSVDPFKPGSGARSGLIDMTFRSGGARYHVLYDLQAGSGEWSAKVLWAAANYDAASRGLTVLRPHLGYGAICSYDDVGPARIGLSCSALVHGVLLQVEAPAPVPKPRTADVVALLRTCIAHLSQVRTATG